MKKSKNINNEKSESTKLIESEYELFGISMFQNEEQDFFNSLEDLQKGFIKLKKKYNYLSYDYTFYKNFVKNILTESIKNKNYIDTFEHDSMRILYKAEVNELSITLIHSYELDNGTKNEVYIRGDNVLFLKSIDIENNIEWRIYSHAYLLHKYADEYVISLLEQEINPLKKFSYALNHINELDKSNDYIEFIYNNIIHRSKDGINFQAYSDSLHTWCNYEHDDKDDSLKEMQSYYNEVLKNINL